MSEQNYFVTMKWGSATLGGTRDAFTATHINNIQTMLEKTQSQPFKLFCLTDTPEGLDDAVEYIPLPDSVKQMIRGAQGNFAKLYLFSQEFRKRMAQNFVFLDIDVVLCGDVSDVFARDDGLVILEGPYCRRVSVFTDPKKHVVGRSVTGFVKTLMTRGPRAASVYLKYAGSRWCMVNSSFVRISPHDPDLWAGFDPVRARAEISAAHLIGTDQAWVQLAYPGQFDILGHDDGFWRHPSLRSHIRRNKALPDGLKFVAFPGDGQKPWLLRDDPYLAPVLAQYPEKVPV